MAILSPKKTEYQVSNMSVDILTAKCGQKRLDMGRKFKKIILTTNKPLDFKTDKKNITDLYAQVLHQFYSNLGMPLKKTS